MLENFLRKKGVDTCNINEVIKALGREGLITTNIDYYQEVYSFMKELEKTGAKNKEVVLTTMEHYRISRVTCYRIYKKISDIEKGS